MPQIDIKVTAREAMAIDALVKYIRRPGKTVKPDPIDFPKYTDSDSFIRLADEARDAKGQK